MANKGDPGEVVQAPWTGAVPAAGVASIIRIPVPGPGNLAIELTPRNFKGKSTSALFIQDQAGKRTLRLVAHQTCETTPAGGHSALLLWHIEPSPVDAGVPREIAEVLARVLTALGQVAFRWSGEPTWPLQEADTIEKPHRGLLQRASDWFMTSWPTDVVITRSTSVAVHLFDHGWEDQGQVALVIDPKEGAVASALVALQTLRDWRRFAMPPPVHALIAPSTDGDGVLFTATSPKMLEDIVRCLAQKFGDAGIEFLVNSS